MADTIPSKPGAGRRVSALRGAIVLMSGSGAGFVLKFLRTVLFARLLTVADFGVVGVIMAAIQLLNTMSNFKFQMLLVQDKRGNDQDFVAAIKGLDVARGVFVAAMMLVFAGPIATLMGQPDLVWAYRCLAILPLLRAFKHADLFRMRRQMRFGPGILNGIGGQVAGLLLIWPMVLLFGDYRALLVLIVLQTLLTTVLSHFQAEYPFRVGWDWAVVRRGLSFGWPLLISGIILFGILQGDRIIVSNFYTAEQLGLIAAALALVTSPVLFCVNMVRGYFLPIMARHQDRQRAFDERAAFTMQATLCTALLASLGFGLLGPYVLVLAFGEKFADAAPYLATLGVGFSLQVMRSGTTTVAMARGNTLNLLYSNLARLVFFAPAIWLAIRGWDLVGVLAVGALGQFVATAFSIALLYIRTRLGNWRMMALPYAVGGVSLASLVVAIWQPATGYVTPGPAVVTSGLAFIATVLLSRAMLDNLRSHVLERLG